MRHTKTHRTIQERFGDPIGSYAGDAPVGVRSVQEMKDGEVCDGCGLMPVDGECACTPTDDVMTVDHSGSMIAVREGVEPCSECGMLEVEGEGCGCTHMAEYGMEEVAPPGKEKMVKALKKEPDVENPYAVAWAAHNKQKQGR